MKTPIKQDSGFGGRITITDAKDRYVRSVQVTQTGPAALCEWQEPERKANATDILRAVNSHDDLVAACEAALDVILFTVDREKQLQVADQLAAVIVKVKG